VKLAYAVGFVVNAWGLAAERHEYRALGQAASSASLALLLAVWHARLGCVNSQYAACGEMYADAPFGRHGATQKVAVQHATDYPDHQGAKAHGLDRGRSGQLYDCGCQQADKQHAIDFVAPWRGTNEIGLRHAMDLIKK
jgi:hypothetical protein